MRTVNITQDVIDFGLSHKYRDDIIKRNDHDFKIWEVKESPWPELKLSSGLVAEHNTPFNLHSDTFFPENRCNLIIPLEMSSPQSLLVMDQTYEQSAVWIDDDDKKNIPGQRETDPDNILYQRPCDTPGVMGLTNEPAPDNITNNGIFDSDFYYGLTGTVWEWEIGKGGIFHPTQLHGTGNMRGGEKTTMTLWFDQTPDEVYECLSQ